MPKIIVCLSSILLTVLISRGQDQSFPPQLIYSGDSTAIMGVKEGSFSSSFSAPVPLVTFRLNGRSCSSADHAGAWSQSLSVHLQDGILSFTNTSNDTVVLSNPVPFGESGDHVYITGLGDHPLSRTHLFLPGRLPVNVIVPDNAWDMGYCSFNAGRQNHDSLQLTALLRRDRRGVVRGHTSRFETTLYPGGVVRYKWYTSLTPGGWREALTEVFQSKMLYDTTRFDDSLFRRKDLQWVRNTYVLHIMMNWDRDYYNSDTRKFYIDSFLTAARKWYGGDDVLAIWPTWPTLGLDQRNQFDMFRDLPGGLPQIRTLSDLCHSKGTRLFICYNPWDEGTHREDHFEGLSRLIAATAADGVVLDTKGSSSKELQDAADKVRKGVVMYSEGMAVPKDMAGIVSGRVHNALYYPPMLNLNKLIKPEFTIYRVTELYKERIRRELALAFFNGYGTELNIMPPGKPEWVEDEYRYLGRTTRILRENTLNFVSRGFTPLLATTADSIWVNSWEASGKALYTIFSLRPSGYKGLLFPVTPDDSIHYVDLWHHEPVIPRESAGQWWLTASADAFNASDLGTNNEGEVDCIARLPRLLRTSLNGDLLTVGVHLPAGADSSILEIWAGVPSYDKKPLQFPAAQKQLILHKYFGNYEGRVVIRLMKNGLLQDESVVELRPGQPRRISRMLAMVETSRTPSAQASAPPPGMVLIPAGPFHFKETHGDEFIPYPRQDVDSNFAMPPFLMDRHPVTNGEFRRFLQATHYRPSDTANFLKHWIRGHIPAGQEDYPVVNVSYEDAQAYAKWAGKRLPTELEWQYAAQTSALNPWPWRQTTPVTWKEEVVTESLTVKEIHGIDPSRCNLGNGSLYSVGKYPAGANPYGLQDLVGCVWQMTDDIYMTGNYRYIMLKGGSYFRPSGSWWYVQGGPRELTYRQFLLRVSQGFERNATVGFRCVRNINSTRNEKN